MSCGDLSHSGSALPVGGAQEERLRLLVEEAGDLLSRHDRGGTFLDASPACRSLLRCEPGELIGRRLHDLVHPDDREELGELFSSALEPGSGVVTGVYRARLSDGSHAWFESTLRATAEHEGATVELIAVSRAASSPPRSLGVGRLQQEKAESLTVLAGALAHELNNHLTGVLGYARLALDEVATESALGKRLRPVEAAGRRMAQLVDELLTCAGEGELKEEPVDLSGVVAGPARLLAQRAAEAEWELELELEPDLPVVQGDPAQLGRVVRELTANAVEALSRATPGRLLLRTGAAELPASLAQDFRDAPRRGPWVFLEVSDNGVGMSQADLARAFDPFFSTTPGRRGLGLTAARGIARRHGGTVSLSSEPEGGTRVTVYLPQATEVCAGGEDAGTTSGPRALRGAKVLVAEDEDGVRLLTQQLLERWGCRVVTACDGYEAIQLFEECAAEVDLVILDLNMPRMGGESALRRIRRRRPQVPILVCSGFIDPRVLKRIRATEEVGFLHKPFTSSRLLEAIRGFLSQGS